MMRLANASGAQSQGIRMGVWGAAQAIAFGIGNLLGTVLSDLAHWLLSAPAWSYATVFLVEAVMFLFAARLAVRVGQFDAHSSPDDLAMSHSVQRMQHEH
jgi:BCD family chlorophyll transporter-like MFS transporter